MMGRLLVMILITSVLGGCASLRAASERRRIIQQETAGHVYAEDCKKVLPQSRSKLFEDGYSVKDTGEDAFTVETEWLYSDTGSTRYLIQGVESDDGTCRVQAMRARKNEHGVSTGRDVDFEWEVLQRSDAEAASRILQQADVAAQAAASKT